MKKPDVVGIEESDKILNLQHCNLEVAGKRYLDTHLQRKHRDQHIGDFSCKFCDYSSTLVTLEQHTCLKHKQEGVKMCKHCGCQTTSASKLGRHRLDVHGNTRGRRKLEVDYINQELVTPVNEVYKEITSSDASMMKLKLNSRGNNNSRSNEQVDDEEKEKPITDCDKEDMTPPEEKKVTVAKNPSIRNTLEKKVVPCGECSRVFSNKKDLGDHVQSHTGKIPQTCYVCGEIFYMKINMSQHAKKGMFPLEECIGVLLRRKRSNMRVDVITAQLNTGATR